MKCIKAIKDGTYSKKGDVKRVENQEAQDRVDSKFWAFVPKSEWKALTRKKKETEVEAK